MTITEPIATRAPHATTRGRLTPAPLARIGLVGATTCAATLLGLVLTRTTGLPGVTGDIGNWGETIAVWSLLVEGAFVLLAGWALGMDRDGNR